MKIIEVNHGLANNFGDYIEINKNLKKYPKLYDSILKHELSHTSKPFSKEDFKLDFLMTETFRLKLLLKFMITHPRSFSQILPFYYSRKKGFVLDINMCILHTFVIGIVLGSIWVGLKIL